MVLSCLFIGSLYGLSLTHLLVFFMALVPICLLVLFEALVFVQMLVIFVTLVHNCILVSLGLAHLSVLFMGLVLHIIWSFSCFNS
jgi:hypothetical protein